MPAVISLARDLRHDESCPISERGLEAMRQAFAGIVNEYEIGHNAEIIVGENSMRMSCRACEVTIQRSIYLLPDRQTVDAVWGQVIHHGECPAPSVGAGLGISGIGALAGSLGGAAAAPAAVRIVFRGQALGTSGTSEMNLLMRSSRIDSTSIRFPGQLVSGSPPLPVIQPLQAQLAPEEVEHIVDSVVDSRVQPFFSPSPETVAATLPGFRYAVTIRVPEGGARFVYTEEVDSLIAFLSANRSSHDFLGCSNVCIRHSSCPVMFPRCVHLYLDPCPELQGTAYFNTMEESERFAAWMRRAMGTDGQMQQQRQPQVRQPQKRLVIAT